MPLLDVNYRGTRLWEGSLRTSLDALYERRVGVVPDRTGTDIVGETLAGLSYLVSDIDIIKPGKEKRLVAAVEGVLDKKPWIVEKIKGRLPSEFFLETSKKEKCQVEPVFTRGSIFLVYLLAEKAPFRLKAAWPTLPDALLPVLTDSGISFGDSER